MRRLPHVLALTLSMLVAAPAAAQSERDSVRISFQVVSGAIPAPGSGCAAFGLGSHPDPVGNGRDSDYAYPWDVDDVTWSDGYGYADEPPGWITDEAGERIVFVSIAGSGPCHYVNGTIVSQFNDFIAGLPPRYAYYTPQPNEPPRAAFEWEASGSRFRTVHFDATRSDDEDGQIVSYEWDFGDGTTGRGESTSHTYDERGTYDVTLTVEDDDGARDARSAAVDAEGPDLRYVVSLSRLGATSPENESVFEVGDTVEVRIAVENVGEARLEEVHLPGGRETVDVTSDPAEALAPLEAGRERIDALAVGASDTLTYAYLVAAAAEVQVFVDAVAAVAVHPETEERIDYEELEAACPIPDAGAGKAGARRDLSNVPCTDAKTEAPGLVVNAEGDAGLGTDGDGEPLTTCDTGGEPVRTRDGRMRPECTLRAAVQLVNAGEAEGSGGEPPVIAFDVPGATPTITVGEPLALERPVVVDGTTQEGYDEDAGLPVVEVRGGGGDGFVVQAEGTTIRGLALMLFAEAAIRVEAGGVLVERNHIGVDRTGALAGPNGQGVVVDDVPDAVVRQSVISGNRQEGVLLDGPGAANARIEENRIGTSAAGDAALGNGTGIHVDDAPGSLIRGNVIAGTVRDARVPGHLDEERGTGVYLWGEEASGTRIEGNVFGSDPDATHFIPNVLDIYVEAPGTQVGGLSADARNYVASRMEVAHSGVRVQGNYFGTNRDGTRAIADHFAREFVDGANLIVYGDGVAVGGAAPGAGNVFSEGITVYGYETRILNNLIGLQPDGETPIEQPEDHSCDGIELLHPRISSLDVTAPTNRLIAANRIGYCDNGFWIRRARNDRIEGNAIFANEGSGISMLDISNSLLDLGSPRYHDPDEITGVTIRANSIYDNGELGIDLHSDGVTDNDGFNDLDGGANGLQNFPRFYYQAQLDDDGGLFVAGEIPGAHDPGYIVDLYHNEACDGSNGEGKLHLGAVVAETSGLFGIADAEFTFTLAGVGDPVQVGDVLTATATAPDGSTSEFSRCIPIAEAAAGIASAEVDDETSTAAFDDEGVFIGLTSAAGKASPSAAGMLYVTRIDGPAPASRFAGMAAPAPGGEAVQPEALAPAYWYLVDRGITPRGEEPATVALEVCLDPAGLLPDASPDEAVVLRRNASNGWLWTPHATTLRTVGGAPHLCAAGLTALGEFTLGTGEPPALAAPALAAPADGAPDVLLGSTFSWQPVPGAAGYDLQVDLTPAFRAPLVDAGGLVGTSAVPDSLARARVHHWRVRGVTAGGEAGPWSAPLRFTTAATGVDVEDELVPEAFTLEGNYPNPFNPRTTIRYMLPRPASVRLAVFDLLGREVAVLARGPHTAGRHEVVFEASDLATGIYVYRLEAGGTADTGQMVLLK